MKLIMRRLVLRLIGGDHSFGASKGGRALPLIRAASLASEKTLEQEPWLTDYLRSPIARILSPSLDIKS
jgi:hypothetical protein